MPGPEDAARTLWPAAGRPVDHIDGRLLRLRLDELSVHLGEELRGLVQYLAGRGDGIAEEAVASGIKRSHDHGAVSVYKLRCHLQFSPSPCLLLLGHMHLNGQWLGTGVVAGPAADAAVAGIKHIAIASGVELLAHLQHIGRAGLNAPLAGLALQCIDRRIGLVLVPDLHPPDLAADGLGQLRHELDDPGILVGSSDLLDMVLQLLLQLLRGAYPLVRTTVALTTCPRMGSGTPVMATSSTAGWVMRALLHLEGPHPVSGALDHVVRPAHEPEVSVLIPPGGVPGMVVIIMPGVPGLVRIGMVIGEKADGLSLVRPDHNLALFAHLADLVVLVHQDDIESRCGLAHGAGFGLHPGIVGNADHGLGLAESFHEPQAGGLEEALVDGGVERLSGRDRILETGEVVPGHVALDHEPEDGGRRAEGGDPVLAHLVHHLSGIEAIVIVDEDRRSGQPLAVDLAPGALGPSRIGHSVVQPVVLHILPVLGGEDMAQGIGLIVLDHLGVAGGPGGEVPQKDIRRFFVACSPDGRMKSEEASSSSALKLIQPSRVWSGSPTRALTRGTFPSCLWAASNSPGTPFSPMQMIIFRSAFLMR